MASKGQSLTVSYVAWDTVNNIGKTGDVANHTLGWIKDGTVSATTNSPVEVDSTNAPGVYKLVLTSIECTCDYGVLAGKSSTSGVAIIPISISFEQLPTIAAGLTGGLPLAVDNSGRVDSLNLVNDPGASNIAAIKAKTDTIPANPASTTNITAGTITNVTNLTNLPTAPVDWIIADVLRADAIAKIQNGLATPTNITSASGIVVQTNNDKSGYSLSTAFPTASEIATAVWASTARTLTAFGFSVSAAVSSENIASIVTAVANATVKVSEIWGYANRSLTSYIPSSGASVTDVSQPITTPEQELVAVRIAIAKIYANIHLKKVEITTNGSRTIVESADFQRVISTLRSREQELTALINKANGIATSIVDKNLPAKALPVVFRGES